MCKVYVFHVSMDWKICIEINGSTWPRKPLVCSFCFTLRKFCYSNKMYGNTVTYYTVQISFSLKTYERKEEYPLKCYQCETPFQGSPRFYCCIFCLIHVPQSCSKDSPWQIVCKYLSISKWLIHALQYLFFSYEIDYLPMGVDVFGSYTYPGTKTYTKLKL